MTRAGASRCCWRARTADSELRSLWWWVRPLPRPSRLRLPLPPRLPSLGILLRLRAPVLLPILADRHLQRTVLFPALRVLRERPVLLFPVRDQLCDRSHLLRT